MNNLEKIFKSKKIIIGALHLMSLLGYKEHMGLDIVLKKAFFDLDAFEKGGVDGVIIENNYDIPHKEFVGSETVACMTYLVEKIIKKAKIPIGISVLWNDYKTALSIAKVCGGKFVRVPVFVDNVVTSYGKIYGNPSEVNTFRQYIHADDVLLFADIHVKHARLLNKDSIEFSAKKAIENGADALIVTGKWTADAPALIDLQKVKKIVGNFPIFIGSGATKENIQSLLALANGVIVGTSLKTGKNNKKHVNIKKQSERIDKTKVISFVKRAKQIT